MSKWALETRPQFLILSVLLVAHGAALVAWQQGHVDWLRIVLAMIALVLMHASSNVLNDWHDFVRSGIDKATVQTPFSGGSGLLPKGIMTPNEALALGIGTLVVGVGIGVYLATLAGVAFLVVGLVGVLLIVLYTPFFTRIGLGEIAAGLGLGLLPIVAMSLLLTEGSLITTGAWVSGLSAGFLVYNLLLMNEFPDTSADKAGGRRHMIVLLGKRRAAVLYSVAEVAAFVTIAAGVASGVLTPWALLGLLGGIFAFKAITTILANYDSFEGAIPAMGAHVLSTLSTNALLAVGYTIAALLRW